MHRDQARCEEMLSHASEHDVPVVAEPLTEDNRGDK